MPCPIPFRVLRRLPFRIDRTIQNIWGPSEHLPLLRDRIRQSRKIDPLIVGDITGLKRPVLIDGLTRLTAHHELIREGIDVPYAVEHRQYKSYADAVEDVVAIQRARRNISEGQIALALLEAERARCGSLPSRGRGRPTKKASALAFPSAKVLAKRAGVSDWTFRVMTRAMLKNPTLVDKVRNGEISVSTAHRRLKSQSRDEGRAARRQATVERRKIIEGLPAEQGPEAVTADGIFCGDAVQTMQRIEAGTISLIATSIPYPCSIEYDARRAFGGSYDRYRDELRAFVAESKRVLRVGGRLAINFDFCAMMKRGLDKRDEADNLFNLWMELSVIAQRENGLLFFDAKNWFKQNAAGGFAAKGSVGSCRAPRGNFNGEPILVFAKDSTTLDGDVSEDDIGHEYNKFALSDWYIRPATRFAPDHPDFHPCPWPEELAYRLIKLYCYRGDVVLDPFNGSGTTTFVARALGRRFVGIDNSPLYCASARRRVARLDGLTPEQMQARIERFVLAAGERADGRENHIKRLGA